MKVYAGAPAAARHYVEADRGRADDYYLAEGTGVARRFTASPDGSVVEVAPLTGESYETWVAGHDPQTGVPWGALRTDARGVRFVEVVVNGPKSWSLAAALHPDIAAAYDAAQDRAAEQVIGWLAEHATTRVGPRGGQVQVPVQRLEAVTVAHRTSRAGDPHRHLHLQINARVFAAGKWRGLHTVGVRDSLAAINGIGHAAVISDPQFRAALAAHGYALNPDGEIRQLADFVGAFSARAAQITRNIDAYEREWALAHPGERPGPGLRRAWDARAWADGRPDKVSLRPGANLDDQWRTELTALGYRDCGSPVSLAPPPVGSLDRDAAVQTVLTRLAADRSAWNAADVRGEAEQLLAAAGIVADPAVRIELAEDLTARALSRCVPLLDRGGLPEHIRAWTSPAVRAIEADLKARLADRGRSPMADAKLPSMQPEAPEAPPAGQGAVVAALTGDRSLVVVEGAAGAGKTTTLAATRRLLERSGRRLVVVTPTLKAAKVASAEVGAAAGSAAWLAHQHGWRWPDDGAWIRLAIGDTDPVTGAVYRGADPRARLGVGDLLVVDEAGMLDQDTARALLVLADQARVRVALVGDRHQLPAVGRGGVLDLAVCAVDPAGHLTLTEVHRFTRTDAAGRVTPDREYADLTLAMRRGEDPGAVFDALLARGRIRLHHDPAALREALAGIAAEHHHRGQRVALVVDTREQVAELSAAVRDRLVAGGRVDNSRVATTRAGQRIGAGDQITTRRNDRTLHVANRDSWTVTAVGPGGELVIAPADQAPGAVAPKRGVVAPATAGERVLPAGYVTEHVELAYATTAHGAQGDTLPAAHLLVGAHTGAASAYVGMTRGRQANIAHFVAAHIAEAREQWIAVFARDRADLGPAHAARLAGAEAARYATGPPLDQVLADLHAAWTAERDCLERLKVWEPHRDTLRRVVTLDADHVGEIAELEAACRRTALTTEQTQERAHAGAQVIAAETDRHRDALLAAWDGERDAARSAAGVLLAGPGRLGRRRGAVAGAREQLTGWADRWRPLLPHLPTEPTQLARTAQWFDDRPALCAAVDAAAHRAAEHHHPEGAQLRAAVDAAATAHNRAGLALAEAHRRRHERMEPLGVLAWISHPQERLVELQRDLAATRRQLTDARARIATLTAEPALLALPPNRLHSEREAWRTRRDADRDAAGRTPPYGRKPGLRPASPRPQNPAAYAAPHPRGREVPR